MFTEGNFLSSVLTKMVGIAVTFTLATEGIRKWPRGHLENLVLTFRLLTEERDTENEFPHCRYLFLFLLIADAHQSPCYPSLFPDPHRVLSCGPSSCVTAACCFWRAQYYCLAWVLASDSEVVAGKSEPCPALSHEGLASSQRKIS